VRSIPILQRKTEGYEINLKLGISTSISSWNLEDLEEGVRRGLFFSELLQTNTKVHTVAEEVPFRLRLLQSVDYKLYCCLRHCASGSLLQKT